MKVLLTGAFGNIGSQTLESLIEQGHQVRCFDIQTRANKKVAGRFKDRVEVEWGDLRNPDAVSRSVEGCDTVIHLAFIIPPMSEERPQWAHEVNVGGTRNILEAMKSLCPSARIVFASSVSIFGQTQHLPPPRKAIDPIQTTDHYTRHKAECEKLVQGSGSEWVVLRFGAVPQMRQLDPIMFDIPLENRIEFLHPRDVGLAVSNAVSCEVAQGKILLIGGGQNCQIRYRDFIGGLLEGVGVGMLPDWAFSKTPYYTDWMDTSESQRLLRYQRYSFDDFRREVRSTLGYQYHLTRMLRPLIRHWILSKSPYSQVSGGKA